MGKSSKEAYGAVGADTLLLFDPDQLTLVTEKDHPLYDERVEKPIDEKDVLNVMSQGIHEPIIVRLNGQDADGKPIVEVVDGRQRVKWAIEANKRLKKEGKELIRIPAVRKRADAPTLMGVMISTNEIRKDDEPLIKAQKLQRYLAIGRTEEDAAITFGVSKQTIKNWLALLELHPTVQKKVGKELPAAVAKDLAALPQEEQVKAMEEMIEKGETKGGKGKERVRKIKAGRSGSDKSDKVKVRSALFVENFSKELKGIDSKVGEVAYAVARYILGHKNAFSNFPQLKEAAEKADSK